MSYTQEQETLRNAFWNFLGGLIASSPHQDQDKVKENVTALVLEEICKISKNEDETLNIQAAKPILKAAEWVVSKRIEEVNLIGFEATEDVTQLKELLSKYVNKI